MTPWTSPPGSFVRGISQARILEWVAISFSRGFSRSKDQTHVSCIGRQILYHGAPRDAWMQVVGEDILGWRKGDSQGPHWQVLWTLQVAKVNAVWDGLGLKRWLRSDPKQCVWGHTRSLNRKKKTKNKNQQPSEHLKYLHLFLHQRCFFFKCLGNLFLYNQHATF